MKSLISKFRKKSVGEQHVQTKTKHSQVEGYAVPSILKAGRRTSLANASTRVRPAEIPSSNRNSPRLRLAHTKRALPIELDDAIPEQAIAPASFLPEPSRVDAMVSKPTKEQSMTPRAFHAKRRASTLKISQDVGLESEIFGVMLIFVGVLISLALISFAPEQVISLQPDVQSTQGISLLTSGHIHNNWVGPIGVLVADGLTQFMGYLSYLMPLFFFYLGALFLGATLAWPNGMHVGGLMLGVWGTATLLEIGFRAPEVEYFAAGGWVGALWYQTFVPLLAVVGTGLFSLVLILSGILVFYNMSIRTLFKHMGSAFSYLVQMPRRGNNAWEDFLDDEDELYLEEVQETASRRNFLPDLDFEHTASARDDSDKSEVSRAHLSKDPTLNNITQCSTPRSLENQRALSEPVDLKSDDGDAITQSARPSGIQKKANAKYEAAVAPEPKTVVKTESSTQEDEAFKIVQRADEHIDIDDRAIQKDKKYVYPPLKLLDFDAPNRLPIDGHQLQIEADKLVRKFKDFGIEGRVKEVRPGPVVTTFEFVPAPGIKLSKIASLSDDIAMAMEAVQVRIVAPIPGKGAVGIEIPNERRETVFLKEIMADKTYQSKLDDKLLMALGKDIEGKPYYANLAEMPHALISGTTGSGKSVSVNGMITSILYRAKPDEVKFMMIDPKMLELSIYEGIPHLLLPPIIDSKKAANALQWAVAEMERRYLAMSEIGVRSIDGFNKVIKKIRAGKDPAKRKAPIGADGKPYDKLPFIVIVIDEYADLLSIAGKEVEGYVMRLAQKARAAGIHVMLATQRPSVDVITGVIKANFPVRMGFRLASTHDSKTIINRPGAEKLLGKGDMLIMPAGTSNVTRVHGAFISEHEIHRVVEHLKKQGTPNYNMEILNPPVPEASEDDEKEQDEKWGAAIDLIRQHQKCSTSWLQRHLGIGYNRAARLVDSLEAEGIVGPQQNAKGDREIFVR